MNLKTMKRKMLQLSDSIKAQKYELRNGDYDHETNSGIQATLYQLRNLYRSMHIAYGIHKGFNYCELESKCTTEPDWGKVVLYLDKLGFDPVEYESDENLHLPPQLRMIYFNDDPIYEENYN